MLLQNYTTCISILSITRDWINTINRSYHHKEVRACAGYNAAVLYVQANAYRLKADNAKAIAIVLLTSLIVTVYLAVTLMLPKF